MYLITIVPFAQGTDVPAQRSPGRLGCFCLSAQLVAVAQNTRRDLLFALSIFAHDH